MILIKIEIQANEIAFQNRVPNENANVMLFVLMKVQSCTRFDSIGEWVNVFSQSPENCGEKLQRK